ncbi:MAG TPA: hypothetical protein VHB25_10425 [Gemmatimonadaceae bacterium]|nr:hypothetical protein [Gemmatimonadaceae bacterium]
MMMNSSIRCLAAGLAVSFACAGCYAYLPPDPPSQPLVGRTIEATLTDSGAVVLTAKIGPQVAQVRGRVLSVQPGAISLAMDETVQRDGDGTPWKHEVIEVPRPLIDAVAVKQFSPSRTVLFTALTSVVMVAIERGFLHSGGANAPGTAQTGTPGAK